MRACAAGGQASAESETIGDVLTGMPMERSSKPWQEWKYTADNSVWQRAAARRRIHPRRTNVSLGTLSVDLSGPHERTPRPGGHLNKNPCRYVLVPTVRPDFIAPTRGTGTQTGSATEDPTPSMDPEKWVPPLYSVYLVTLLSTKGEATTAMKHL